MTTSQADSGRPAEPMRGPDFVMEKVVLWEEQLGGISLLVLRDGSRWQLDSRRPDYAPQVTFIVNAMRNDEELLVSGNRRFGLVERTAASRRLAAQRIESTEAGGRYSVLFSGPPSIYYLRMDRPDAAHTLALLKQSASGDAFLDTPDLVVGIDTVVSEVVVVKAVEPRLSPMSR